jgi:hypothetical protein
VRVPWIRLAAVVGLLLPLPRPSGVALAQAAPSQRPVPPVVKVGDHAPDFSLVAGDGQTHTLAALHGEKRLVLVVFRGTW